MGEHRERTPGDGRLPDDGASGASDIAPPEQPGWYADAQGAWWWWDGGTWTPAPGAGPRVDPQTARSRERSQALIMWVVFLVGGGWIGALVFYLISDAKRFTKHHAAEALNLTIVLIVPNVVAIGLLVAGLVRWAASVEGDADPEFAVSGLMVAGFALLTVLSVVSYGLTIAGAVQAHRGRWYRLPIGWHPVRGVLAKGEAPPYDVGT